VRLDIIRLIHIAIDIVWEAENGYPILRNCVSVSIVYLYSNSNVILNNFLVIYVLKVQSVVMNYD